MTDKIRVEKRKKKKHIVKVLQIQDEKEGKKNKKKRDQIHVFEPKVISHPLGYQK